MLREDDMIQRVKFLFYRIAFDVCRQVRYILTYVLYNQTEIIPASVNPYCIFNQKPCPHYRVSLSALLARVAGIDTERGKHEQLHR